MFESLGGEQLGLKPAKRSKIGCWIFAIIAVSVIGPIIMTVIFIGIMFFGVKSVDEYQCAMTEIRSNKQAIEVLGEPMNEGLFILPNIEIAGSRRDVNFQTSMTGPKASATLTVSSYRDRFKSNFQMYLEQDGRDIKLYNDVYPCE